MGHLADSGRTSLASLLGTLDEAIIGFPVDILFNVLAAAMAFAASAVLRRARRWRGGQILSDAPGRCSPARLGSAILPGPDEVRLGGIGRVEVPGRALPSWGPRLIALEPRFSGPALPRHANA